MENNNIENKTSILSTEGILSVADGIPLPPVVKRNLWKAVGNLISSAVEIPVAYLESKSRQIRNESDGLTLVTKTASEIAAVELRNDPQLVNRAVNHFSSRLFKEQINREAVLQKAMDELKESPPEEESEQEIDPDWLEYFSRVSETKSNEDVRLFLGKMLAGEIKSPGTFSQKTLQVLSTLDRDVAQVFQDLCNISISVSNSDRLTCVPYKAFGDPGSNGLESLGLPYGSIALAQDAGLVQTELSAYKNVPKELFDIVQTNVGSSSYQFRTTPGTSEVVKLEAINFTKVGIELRKVIHITSIPIFNDKFIAWMKSTHGIDVI